MRLGNRKGISPVIATIIIVAVTLTIAISIAYWMGGIAGLYTRFEKLEITNIYMEKKTGYWLITLTVKNTGSADATIDDIMLNGVTISKVSNGTHCASYNTTDNPTDNPTITLTDTSAGTVNISIASGGTIIIYIALPENAKMGSGTAVSGLSLEIKLHTASGKDYPKLVVLS